MRIGARTEIAQGKVHEEFGFRSRIKDALRYDEGQPVEFALADYPRNRFSGEPPRKHGAVALERFGSGRLVLPRQILRMVQSANMLQQQPCIGPRIVDSRRREFRRCFRHRCTEAAWLHAYSPSAASSVAW